MVDRSDLVVCYVEHETGGAFQTMAYAEKSGKAVNQPRRWVNLLIIPHFLIIPPAAVFEG